MTIIHLILVINPFRLKRKAINILMLWLVIGDVDQEKIQGGCAKLSLPNLDVVAGYCFNCS